MIIPRPAHARGHADHGWLRSAHSFSFADYHDPAQMGWGALRVINEDVVAPGRGFDAHGHRDMEIISYVLEGALEHRDNLGNGAVILPGEVQRMSAGQGVVHSEYNPSRDTPAHFLQIWILPRVRASQPSYEQIRLPPETLDGRLRLIASPDGGAGSVRIQQDAQVFAARLGPGQRVLHRFGDGRLGYLQVVRGEVLLNERGFAAGDGAKIEDEVEVEIAGVATGSEILLFDLPR